MTQLAMTEQSHRYRAYGPRHLSDIGQRYGLATDVVETIDAVAHVLPFRVNDYVLNNLVDWDNIPDDPMFQMLFPQNGMLTDSTTTRLRSLSRRGWPKEETRQVTSAVRRNLNPHPSGQMELNVPKEHDEPIPGLRVDQPTADLRLDVGTHYGLGCYLTPAGGQRPVVGHEGFFEGSWVKLAVDPDRDRGILWIDNRGDELREARYRVIEQLVPGLLSPVEGCPEPGFGSDGKDVLAADVAGSYQRLGSPALRVAADGTDLLLDLDGRRRRLSPFARGIWRTRATGEDTGCWRPHAGSGQVCLGTAPPDDDGTRVVHLNAIPYSSPGN